MFKTYPQFRLIGYGHVPNDFDAFSIKMTSSFVGINKFRFSHRVKRGDSHEVTNPTYLNNNKKETNP
jgi:hypothetical protein